MRRRWEYKKNIKNVHRNIKDYVMLKNGYQYYCKKGVSGMFSRGSNTEWEGLIEIITIMRRSPGMILRNVIFYGFAF